MSDSTFSRTTKTSDLVQRITCAPFTFQRKVAWRAVAPVLTAPKLLLGNKRTNLYSKQNSPTATDRQKHTMGNIKQCFFFWSDLHSNSDI